MSVTPENHEEDQPGMGIARDIRSIRPRGLWQLDRREKT
jgi:hypothetical protein